MKNLFVLLGSPFSYMRSLHVFQLFRRSFSFQNNSLMQRRRHCFLLGLLMAFMGAPQFATAQVKIGDNPETINPNSLLELEGTNKGLLAPRVALADAGSVAPLSAPVPAGMIVYNSGTVLPSGFYFWNGTKWLAVQTTESGRTNFVLVKSAADLPAPQSGIITLKAGTTYEVNGTVSLASKINLNGCYLVGQDANNDKLVFTGSGELFTGNKGGTLKSLTMVAAGASSKLFGLDLSAAENLLVRDAIIANCTEVGLVKGGYMVFFSVINYSNNTKGITYQDNTNLLLDNTAWFANNTGTFEKMVGAFNHINKLGGFSMPQPGSTAFDVAGITFITEAGNLKNSTFMGSGTKVAGSFTKKWEVEAAGIPTEKDAVATASFYISAPVLTGINKVNTPVKISGATTASELVRFIAPTNNRLQYDGTKPRTFFVNAALSVTGTANTYTYSFYISKNGVLVPGSRQRTKVYSSSGDVQTVGMACTVALSPGDYIEVWAENNESTYDLTAQNLTLIIK